MTKRSSEELISDLAEEDRKSMEEKIKMLHYVVRNCELYLQDYAAGQQTAYKFLVTTEWVCKEIAETPQRPGHEAQATIQWFSGFQDVPFLAAFTRFRHLRS